MLFSGSDDITHEYSLIPMHCGIMITSGGHVFFLHVRCYQEDEKKCNNIVDTIYVIIRTRNKHNAKGQGKNKVGNFYVITII